MTRTTTGRPSKGERDAILAKPPLAFGAILKKNADEADLPYGEYLVALAAQALNMPQYAPAPARDRTSELSFPEETTTRAA